MATANTSPSVSVILVASRVVFATPTKSASDSIILEPTPITVAVAFIDEDESESNTLVPTPVTVAEAETNPIALGTGVEEI